MHCEVQAWNLPREVEEYLQPHKIIRNVAVWKTRNLNEVPGLLEVAQKLIALGFPIELWLSIPELERWPEDERMPMHKAWTNEPEPWFAPLTLEQVRKIDATRHEWNWQYVKYFQPEDKAWFRRWANGFEEELPAEETS